MIEFITSDDKVIDVVTVVDGELLSGPATRDVVRSWLRQGNSPDDFEQAYSSWTNGYSRSRRVADDDTLLSKLKPVAAPSLVAAGDFDESEHPRDGKGRFAKKAGGGSVPKGKKIKVTHMLVHKKHAPGTIIAIDGGDSKRVVWDGNKYLLQEKQSNGGWTTTSTAIKSKAYVEVGKFGDDWREPGDDAKADDIPLAAPVAPNTKVNGPKPGQTGKKAGASKGSAKPGSPLKITHALVHQVHEKYLPGTVVAQNGANDKRVVWDGEKYRLQSKPLADGKWTTEQTAIKSKAYVAVNAFDSDWRVPPDNDNAPATSTPDATPGADTAPTPAPAPVKQSNNNLPSTDGYVYQSHFAPVHGAKQFNDSAGNEWLIYGTDDADKSKTQVLASQLYAKLGFDTPQTDVVALDKKNFPGAKNGFGTRSVKVEGLSQFSQVRKLAKEIPSVRSQFHDTFAVDLWLGNSQTVAYEGLTVTNDGKLVHSGFNEILTSSPEFSNSNEITHEDVDYLLNAPGAYSELHHTDVVDSVRYVQAIQPEDIDQLVDSLDFTPDAASKLKTKLKARRQSLIDLYAHALEWFPPKTLKPSTPIGPKVKDALAPPPPATDATPDVTPDSTSTVDTTPATDTPVTSTPKSIANYVKVGGQKGTQLGGTFVSPSGTEFYVKASKSDDHARNEVLANNLYQALGVKVPKTELVHIEGGHFPGKEGTLGTQSRVLKNGAKNLPQQLKDPVYKKELHENFAIDAWLGNWDVIGQGFDNVITTEDGKPARVDQGGALLFRAQGAPKGAAFGDTVTEIDTLRNPSKNSASALAFKDVTDEDIRQGVQKIESFQPEEIDYWVDQAGFTGATATQLKSTLKARRQDLINKYGSKAPKPTATSSTAPAPSTQPTASNALGGTVKAYTWLQKTKVQTIFNKKNLKWHNKTSEIYDAALEVSTTHPDLTMADALAIMDQSLKKKTGNPFQTKVEKWLKTKAGKQHAISKGGSASIGSTAAKPVPATSVGTTSPASSSSSSSHLSSPGDKYVDHGGPLPRKLTKDKANILQQRMDKATPPPWTDDQRKALRRYTSGEYREINKCARGTAPCTDDILKVLADIKAGMKPSTDNVVVFRKTNAKSFGLNSAIDMEDLVGKTISDDGVISTSIKSDIWSGELSLEIEVPEGSMIAWVQPISMHPSEQEIVLAPGTHYEVVSYTYDPYAYDSGHKVKLRIIPGSDLASKELQNA